MGTVVARRLLPGASAGEVEALWLDRTRWTSFVDGFGAIARDEGDWPHPGARIVWDSLRNGRGRVVEHVVEYQPGVMQSARVEDPELTGTQTAHFSDVEGGCEIAIVLEYELKQAGVRSVLTDRFFVRRALGDALRRTLRRFAVELEADRDMDDQTLRPPPHPRNDKEY